MLHYNVVLKTHLGLLDRHNGLFIAEKVIQIFLGLCCGLSNNLHTSYVGRGREKSFFFCVDSIKSVFLFFTKNLGVISLEDLFSPNTYNTEAWNIKYEHCLKFVIRNRIQGKRSRSNI